jgi:hypothetical protein
VDGHWWCPVCPWSGPVPVLRFREMENGNRHLGAFCRDCGRWIKWVKQDEEALRAARLQREVRGIG